MYAKILYKKWFNHFLYKNFIAYTNLNIAYTLITMLEFFPIFSGKYSCTCILLSYIACIHVNLRRYPIFYRCYGEVYHSCCIKGPTSRGKTDIRMSRIGRVQRSSRVERRSRGGRTERRGRESEGEEEVDLRDVLNKKKEKSSER